MKKLIVFLIIIIVTASFALPLDTYHSSWHMVRATADEDGATFAAVYDLTTDGDFASKDSNTVALGGPFRILSTNKDETISEGYSAGSRWMFAICGKCYNGVNDTFSYDIVGWSKTNGMLQHIAGGTGILGTQSVVKYPHDGSDALGSDVSVSDANYVHTGDVFTVTDGGFSGAVVGMMAYVTSPNEGNLTSGFYPITAVTDANNITMTAATSTADIATTTVKVDINPAFWADTIVITALTKWPLDVDGDGANPMVYNSTTNEVAVIVLDLTGIEWLQFIIYDADAATGEQAGDLTVYGRRY